MCITSVYFLNPRYPSASLSSFTRQGRGVQAHPTITVQIGIKTRPSSQLERTSDNSIHSAIQANTHYQQQSKPRLSNIMHFSLPLIIAGAASLCTAAPVISTDNPVLEKRMDIGNDVTPFLSGETMNMDQIQKGVNIWCSSEL
jgi:hypothetical protein